MANATILKIHRTWEDWAGIGLGVMIVLSPWIAGQTADNAIVLTTIVIGLMVMLLAQFELVSLHRSLECGELACGIALMLWPFAFGYAVSGDLRFWHFALGGCVALLALLELWQDRDLSNEKLARHGR